MGGDLITHQYAQVQARPSNAPGYPLYTMGGWLWFHSLRTLIQKLGLYVGAPALPNPIPLLSSYSMLWALVALWLFYRILCHITRSPQRPAGHWPLAWLLAAFYAVTYFFWYYATTTEQYTSAIAQTLGIVYVYLLWSEQNTAEGRRSTELLVAPHHNPHSAFRRLLLLAFLCGLSLAHMLTVALIVPPVILLVLWQAPALLRSPRAVISNISAALAPLLSYSYVYVRGALHPEWWGNGQWHTAREWFWAFLSTAQGREELNRGFTPGRAFWGGGFPELIWHELSLPLLILGLIGIARLERKLAFLLYSTLTLYGLFCWAYRYGNWFQVILPAYPLILLGVAALANQWHMRQAKNSRWVRNFPLLLILLAIIWRANASWPAANSHHRADDTALDHAAALITQPLPTGAALFAAVDDALALQYLIDIWQIRPDLQVISSDKAAGWLAQNRPVFATWQAAATLRAELPATWAISMQSAGPDWIVLQSGGLGREQPPAFVIDRAIMPGIVLHGYTIAPSPSAMPVLTKAGATLDVTLFWQIQLDDWPEGLSISIRPTLHGALIPAPTGGVIQQDTARPAHGLLALDHWPAGHSVADAYQLPLPAPLPEGADGVAVILYRHKDNGFENVAELNLPLSP
ncbi:MAG: DUF2723 domain-containing protein [Chloroflexi bacterium]|nr:DUF2723 domain-containing protein [Chloroflexota bacterium]